jgi:hypothetical protein
MFKRSNKKSRKSKHVKLKKSRVRKIHGGTNRKIRDIKLRLNCKKLQGHAASNCIKYTYSDYTPDGHKVPLSYDIRRKEIEELIQRGKMEQNRNKRPRRSRTKTLKPLKPLSLEPPKRANTTFSSKTTLPSIKPNYYDD